jgi:tetratricopeptide (TPR) repeat protein
MLQTFEIGRLPAGQWIPGWEQGLLPLTVEPPPRTYPVARPDNAKEPAPRTETARALSDKGLSLYTLDRKDEALNLYDKIARRKAKGPAQRGVAAKALFNKGFLLCELDRKDEALAICYEFLCYRFGENNEPELRGMMEGILSAKKTSLASSRACPPAWDLPNELRNTAQPRPEILLGIRAPDLCSLLPPPYRKRPQQVLEL